MLDFRPVERPYPGLRPFEPWETTIFFGRSEHTDRLQEILKREHFLAVTGPSGCGKSSLVRAGLLPALPLGAVGTGSSWRFAIMRPGDRPIFSLARTLLEPPVFGKELRHVLPGKSDFTEQATEAELWRGPLGLISLVTDAKQHIDDKDCNLLLLVDQFEEIFTYADAGARQADETDAFIDLLLHARDASESRIFVVLTMRTDFLGNCVRFLALPEALNRALYLTPRLTRDQLTQAMSGPARMFGGALDPALANELVNAVANAPDQLPVLQHALARMWDRAIATGQHAPTLRLVDLTEVGGVSKALSQHADEVLATLTPEQQLDAEWLFRAITDQRSIEAGGQMVRRPQSLQRISAWSSRPWETFIPVLKAFAAPHVNFLTYPGQPDDPAQGASAVVDISHEALMRQWGTLKDWIAREAEAGQAYRDLLARARGEAENMRALLYGTDLQNALTWSQEGLQFGGTPRSAASGSKPTPAWATRFAESVGETANSAFALVADYIGRSHEAALTVLRRDQRRRWVLATLSILVFVAGLGLALFGWQMYEKGIVVNAQGLWHPLDFSSVSELDERKFDGLMTLARSPRSERQAFLDLSVARTDLSGRLAYGLPYILNAAVGIDVELHDRLVQRIRSAPRSGDGAIPLVDRVLAQQWLGEEPDLDELFGAIGKTTDAGQLRALGEGLRALASQLDAAQASAVLPQVLETIGKTTDAGQLRALGEGLRALASQLDAAQASAVLPQVLETIGKTTDAGQLRALGEGLRALASQFDAAQASAVLPQVLETIGKTTDAGQLRALGEGLRALASQFDAAQASAVLPQVLETIGKPTAFGQLRALGEGLRALASKLDAAQASVLVAQFLEALGKPTASDQLDVLGLSLRALVSQFDAAQASAVVAQFLEALGKTTASDQLDVLGLSFRALASQFDAAQASAVLPQVLETIGKTTAFGQLDVLGPGLSALAGKLDAAQASAVLPQFLEALGKTTAFGQLYALGLGLSALAGKLDAAQASAVLPQFLEALGKTTASDQFDALGPGLRVLADKLDAAQASTLVTQVLEALGKTTASDQLDALVPDLRALAGKLDADQKASALDTIGASMLVARSGVHGRFLAESASAFLKGARLNGQSARYWIEACRHPFVDRSEVARAIRLGNPGAPGEEQGLWALFRWAVVEYKINPRASLKPPVAENR